MEMRLSPGSMVKGKREFKYDEEINQVFTPLLIRFSIKTES